MRPAAGLAAVALGLLAVLARTHFRGLRYFDRPAFARTPWWDPTLGALAAAGLAGGLMIVALGAPAAAGVLAAILGAGYAYIRLLRSAWFQARLLRRDYERRRRERPGMSREAILYEIALGRHPGWGPELLEDMVRDYPTVESFARILTAMERGFRGFRPGSRRPRGDRAAGRPAAPAPETPKDATREPRA